MAFRSWLVRPGDGGRLPLSTEHIVQTLWVPGSDAMATRARQDIVGIVVHRIQVSQEDSAFHDTPTDIARFFAEHSVGRTATGGAMPYPILIAPDGVVTQTVPLACVTPHARQYNTTMVGVGCIGDFRHVPPSVAQRAALVSVCASLLQFFELPVTAIHSHDGLSGGSHDPDKICPGTYLPLPELQRDVAAILGMPAPDQPYTFVWSRVWASS